MHVHSVNSTEWHECFVILGTPKEYNIYYYDYKTNQLLYSRVLLYSSDKNG